MAEKYQTKLYKRRTRIDVGDPISGSNISCCRISRIESLLQKVLNLGPPSPAVATDMARSFLNVIPKNRPHGLSFFAHGLKNSDGDGLKKNWRLQKMRAGGVIACPTCTTSFRFFGPRFGFQRLFNCHIHIERSRRRGTNADRSFLGFQELLGQVAHFVR